MADDMILNLTALTKKASFTKNIYFYIRNAFNGIDEQLTKDQVKVLVKTLDEEYKQAREVLKKHKTK